MIMFPSVELFFTDDEEEDKLRLSRIRRNIRNHANPLELPAAKFINLFRLNKEAFMYLLNELNGFFKRSIRTSAIPPIIKLCAALRFFADGSYQKDGGNDFDVGLAQPTFSIVLEEILNILEQHICARWIKAAMSNDEIQESKLAVYTQSGFPGVIGFVDGTHVRICAPRKELQHLYLNGLGYYSLNVMIFADYKQNIRYVDARYPGSNHDSHVWNVSTLKKHLEQTIPTNTWIMGDASYPLGKIMMTPFRNPQSGSPQMKFNEVHAKARNSVERTIGALKSKFRCLLSARGLHYAPDKAVKIVNACCALHNISKHFKVQFTENILNADHQQEPTFEENNPTTNAEEEENNPIKVEEAEEMRNNIMRSLQ